MFGSLTGWSSRRTRCEELRRVRSCGLARVGRGETWLLHAAESRHVSSLVQSNFGAKHRRSLGERRDREHAGRPRVHFSRQHPVRVCYRSRSFKLQTQSDDFDFHLSTNLCSFGTDHSGGPAHFREETSRGESVLQAVRARFARWRFFLATSQRVQQMPASEPGQLTHRRVFRASCCG